MSHARLRITVLLALAALAVGVAPGAGAAGQEPQDYIVVLQESFMGNTAAVAEEHARKANGRVLHVYDHALRGFALRLAPAAAERLAARDHRIAYVEADAPVSVVTTQTNATWGLDRIDQRALPLSGTFTYTNTGSGVAAYILSLIHI